MVVSCAPRAVFVPTCISGSVLEACWRRLGAYGAPRCLWEPECLPGGLPGSPWSLPGLPPGSLGATWAPTWEPKCSRASLLGPFRAPGSARVRQHWPGPARFVTCGLSCLREIRSSSSIHSCIHSVIDLPSVALISGSLVPGVPVAGFIVAWQLRD